MAKILIIVGTYNRRDLTGMTLDSVKRGMSPGSALRILDDDSTEFPTSWLERWGPVQKTSLDPSVISGRNRVGLTARRRFETLANSDADFGILMDNDLLVTPGFDRCMLALSEGCDHEHIVTGYLNLEAVRDEFLDYVHVVEVSGVMLGVTKETAVSILDRMQPHDWGETWDHKLAHLVTELRAPHHSLGLHLGVYGNGTNSVRPVTVDFFGDPYFGGRLARRRLGS